MSKYIDADELRQQRPEYLDEENDNRDRAEHAKGWNACNKYWIDILREMPAADVEPVRHGEWKCGEDFGGEYYECEACGRRSRPDLYKFDYCPRCGAKMEGGDKNEQGNII